MNHIHLGMGMGLPWLHVLASWKVVAQPSQTPEQNRSFEGLRWGAEHIVGRSMGQEEVYQQPQERVTGSRPEGPTGVCICRGSSAQ